MKSLKQNKGFTLIETLVAINLMFISVTFIFSFFLFIQKFTGTLSGNFTDKYIMQSLFSKIDLTLRKSDQFIVSFNNNMIYIITDSEDSVIITKESISLTNYNTVTASDNIISKFNLFSNDRIIFENGTIIENTANITENAIHSSVIRSIEIGVEINGKKNVYEIITPAFSVKRFINLEK